MNANTKIRITIIGLIITACLVLTVALGMTLEKFSGYSFSDTFSSKKFRVSDVRMAYGAEDVDEDIEIAYGAYGREIIDYAVIFVFFNVENISSEPQTLSASDFRLLDYKGNKYIAEAFGVGDFYPYVKMNPNTKQTLVLLFMFSVPKGELYLLDGVSNIKIAGKQKWYNEMKKRNKEYKNTDGMVAPMGLRTDTYFYENENSDYEYENITEMRTFRQKFTADLAKNKLERKREEMRKKQERQRWEQEQDRIMQEFQEKMFKK